MILAMDALASQSIWLQVYQQGGQDTKGLVCFLINRFNYRTAFARIRSGVFVHTRGWAPWFHRARKPSIAPMRLATLPKLALRIA